MELYRTVKNEAEATRIIEKSRFIAHVKPVESREEANEFIRGIRAEYRDATHNVPAMVIGDRFQIQWASDDGEPQGTAGAPIVQMLVRERLTNLVLVITRYFGGIKLGTGGLVRAYTASAKLAVEAAGICAIGEVCSMEVEIGYSYLDKIRNVASGTFEIGNTEYGEKVLLTFLVKEEDKEYLTGLIGDITSGSAVVRKEELILAKTPLLFGKSESTGR